MSQRKLRIPRIPLLTLVLLGASVSWLLIGCYKKSQSTAITESEGISVVQASMTGGVSPEVLKTMRWQDVVPTAEVCVNNQLSESVLEHSVELVELPCIYLRGLLHLSLSQPERAKSEWARIDPAKLPVDFLYAPWRLANADEGKNPYSSLLELAVKDGRANALVSARWHATAGDWMSSVEAYLKTDPATWSPHEIEQFRLMKLHRPTAREADLLMAGALRGGRVPQSLRAPMAQLIKQTPQPDREALAAALKSNPALASAATEAASRQLSLRQDFGSNRFSDVVEKIRNVDPFLASDETVMLAFLAAAKVGEKSLADQWSKELHRRNPTTETAKWISEIRQAIPPSSAR